MNSNIYILNIVNYVMGLKKIVKKWGEGLGIYFGKEDIEILQIKEGDILNLEDAFKDNEKKHP